MLRMAMNEYDDMEWVKVIKSAYLRVQEKRYEEYLCDTIEKQMREFE